MEINRRNRGVKRQGYTPVFTEKKVRMNFGINILELMCSFVISENTNIKRARMNFGINILELMCSFVISENTNIKRAHLINMRNLFATIDLSLYENDVERMNRIRFINRGLEARLDMNLKNVTLILTFINGGIVDGDVDASELAMLSNAELAYVNETVSGALECTFIENDIDWLQDWITRYKSCDYRYRNQMVAEYEHFIKDQNSKFRRVKAKNASSTVLSLDGTFEDTMSDIYDELTSPSRMLKCAMQGVNDLTGGGFEATRFYLLLGLAGIGKSMVLLNIALQIKKANKGYVTKDPTKIPTILFLTQENTVAETAERVVQMVSGGNKMSSYSKEDVIRILRNEGELSLIGDNNINIHIMYAADRSIDTGDLYTIIEDLEDDGFEVICLVQDHIKRIRSSKGTADLRLELGDVVNEMKILAQLKQIPIISVSHLNRDASKTVDGNVQGNKADLTRLLGRSNIGESLLMIDNSDCVLIVNLEFDMEGNKYMVFKNIKLRYAGLLRDYICHPFEPGNPVKLIEDLWSLVPVFKESLCPQSQSAPIKQSSNVTMKPSTFSNIKSMEQDDDNIFSNAMYSSTDSFIVNNSAMQPKVHISLNTNQAQEMVSFY